MWIRHSGVSNTQTRIQTAVQFHQPEEAYSVFAVSILVPEIKENVFFFFKCSIKFKFRPSTEHLKDHPLAIQDLGSKAKPISNPFYPITEIYGIAAQYSVA